MSGYNGFSKSNNACAAESYGRFPASVCARELGVPVAFIRNQRSNEWHHTSKHYNVTEYYDLEELREHLESEEGQEELAQLREELKAKKKAPEVVHGPAEVRWLEWGGTRRHPRCTEMTADRATVIDRGGKFVEVRLTDGTTFRKGKATRGFQVTVNHVVIF